MFKSDNKVSLKGPQFNSLPKYLQQHEKIQTAFCPHAVLTLSSLEHHITV